MTFRIEPQEGAEYYKTYQIVAPLATHTRMGTCEEVQCAAFERGWRTTINLSTDAGKRQAHYILNNSGRRFTSAREGAGIVFTFPPGQKCFAEHRVSLARESFYRIRGGDYRGDPLGRGVRSLTREQWTDDFGEHQERLSEARKRG